MKLIRYFQQRVFLVGVITAVFSVISVLVIVILPNAIFNERLDAVKMNIKELAENHLNEPDVEENYNLFIYRNGNSSLQTNGGYILNINPTLEQHLVMWSQLQTEPTKYYMDEFDGEDYVYFITVVEEDYYVITYYDIAEVSLFATQFKEIAGVVLVVLYLASIAFFSVFVNSRFVLQVAFYDPHTNLKTKYALFTRFHKKKLTDYDLTYMVIENLDDVIESVGRNNVESLMNGIGKTIETIYLREGVYQIERDKYLILSDNKTDNTLIEHVFNQSMQNESDFMSYTFSLKMLTIKEELIESLAPEDVLKRFDYAYNKISHLKEKMFEIDEQMLLEINDTLYYSAHLKEALDNELITNFYQPKIDPKTNEVVGCEALSRWVEGDDVVSPIHYVGIAETNGMIVELDLLSFKNSCKLISKLRNKGLLTDNFRVSTNFSPVTLKNIQYSQLEEYLRRYDVEPKHINVEITESIMIEIDQVSKLLKSISDSGMKIEIDDFSAGNSSFAVLPVLNADVIKIDMAVLPDLSDEKEKLIYDSLVDISKKLGMVVTSEGVETLEQVDFLKHKVDYIQGYFYSKPLEYKRFMQFVRYRNEQSE